MQRAARGPPRQRHRSRYAFRRDAQYRICRRTPTQPEERSSPIVSSPYWAVGWAESPAEQDRPDEAARPDYPPQPRSYEAAQPEYSCIAFAFYAAALPVLR